MARTVSPLLIFRLVSKPHEVFESLAGAKPSAAEVFFKLSLWLISLPPLFAYIGTRNFGWRLGATEPLLLSHKEVIGITSGYFIALVIGFLSAALIARWMSWTYEARHSLGIHFAVITVVGAPLAAGSVVHLYPDVFINVLVLVPVLIWSMYLLYKGLPIVLQISPQRGMLMASALILYLLVAAVSLLGLTMFVWTHGIGPRIGV
jgi:hypothetical protein